MEEMIRTERLTKRYGEKSIVDQVSVSVGKGEIYGFLGLNGAGKTTTIRMLLGMIKPSEGDVYLFGQRSTAGSASLWRRVGYLVETPAAYPDFTVRENLRIAAGMHGLTGSKAVDEVMDTLKLTTYAGTKAKHLSLGNAQKLGLAKALVHKPAILILDEPTNALDPAGIVLVRELLRHLAAEQGVTVFISSHILEEIAKIASRIGIIDAGMLLQEISAAEFERLRRKRLYLAACGQESAALAKLQQAGYSLQQDEHGLLTVSDERAVRHPEDVAKQLMQAGIPLSMLKVEEEGLESYFLNLIQEKGGMKREPVSGSIARGTH